VSNVIVYNKRSIRSREARGPMPGMKVMGAATVAFTACCRCQRQAAWAHEGQAKPIGVKPSIAPSLGQGSFTSTSTATLEWFTTPALA
jgi:hypothetical protein